MRSKFFAAALIAALIMTAGANVARAGFPGPPPLPPPPPLLPPPPVPGVSVKHQRLPAATTGGFMSILDSGRPYYVEHERRIYLERRPGKSSRPLQASWSWPVVMAITGTKRQRGSAVGSPFFYPQDYSFDGTAGWPPLSGNGVATVSGPTFSPQPPAPAECGGWFPLSQV